MKSLAIGSRLELFLDEFLVEELRDARLRLHTPRQEEIALKFDDFWDGPFATYATIMRDGEIYRMFYRGKPAPGIDGAEDEVTCYAESDNGIDWVKPSLGLVDIAGSKENNVLLARAMAPGNFSPFLDTNPACPSAQRYKAIAGLDPHGLFAYASPDGLQWQRLAEEPVLVSAAFAFDSQNVAFWSQIEECYVLYFRTWKASSSQSFRWISRSTSPDFVHWTEPVEMDMGAAPLEHLYTNQTQPYFRAPHIYISLASRFWPDKRVIADADAEALGVPEAYRNDCSDVVLMSSRGGNIYNRNFLESFIRPGRGAGNWVSRTNYAALGIVPTGPAEISIYAGRNYAQRAANLTRYSLRLDGFASIIAGYTGGEMLTKPFTFEGDTLSLNYATSAAGSIFVELQDAAGIPLPGLGLGDCLPMVGDEIRGLVKWRGGQDLGALNGRVIRLRFVLKDADIYALQFVNTLDPHSELARV